MTTVFVVDANWYLHRVFFTLRTSRSVEEVLPLNLVGLILKDACAVKATHILVAFDGPSVFRYDIYPEYKANRQKKASGDDDEAGKDIYQYLPAVRKELTRCGLIWIQLKKYEADDVLASAAHQYGSLPNVNVVLGSGDKDGYQSLRANVSAYYSVSDPPRYIKVAHAEKKNGVTVDKMIMYQTLIGDKIDNIPTLRPPAQARKLIAKWGTFANWFKIGDKVEKRWLRANQAALVLNRKLVEMDVNLLIPDVDELKVGKKQLLNMPTPWYVYQDFLYPKTKGLFRR